MRLVFAGTPAVALPSLTALHSSGHEVVAVVTRADARAGRGRTLHPSPVKAWALDHDVEVLTPARAGDPDFLARLSELAPDACPVVAYGQLLPPAALAIPTHGWVNLHFSLLPRWRGAAPVQRAILAGDAETGASTFLIEAGLDTGPVYATLREPIRPEDTSGVLLDRLADLGAGLLVETMDALAAGTATAVSQEGDVTHAAKLTPEDARVDWSAPAAVVDALVRGCTPAPGAWTTFRGQRLKLGPVGLPDDAPALPSGTLAVVGKDVLAGAGDRAVRLGEVQPQGKRMMPAADWARGVRPEAGERFDG